MVNELSALQQNDTWPLVEARIHAPIIGCKWVFKLKTNSDGTTARHKASLVAKGYSQTPGLDYHETFSKFVIKTLPFVLCLPLLSRKTGIFVKLMSIMTFLHEKLHEVVYMHQPLDSSSLIPISKLVCKLNKAIYGLKQAPRAWFDKLKVAINLTGFLAS